MAFRFPWSRQPEQKRTDPIRLAAAGNPRVQPKKPVNVLGSRFEQSGLAVVEPDAGADPYNSTGRLMTKKIRRGFE